MARKIIYNINNFSNGMTSSPRDVLERDKFAYLSHFDIYRDTGKMHVMPGFESFSGFNGNANGIKVYSGQDVTQVLDEKIYLLAKRSDGTGSKIFQVDPGETEWKNPVGFTVNEGADNLVDKPFLISILSTLYYPITVTATGFLQIARMNFSTYSNSWTTDDGVAPQAVGAGRYNVIDNSPTGTIYFSHLSGNGTNSLASLNTSGVTWSAKTTGFGVRDLAASDYTISIATSRLNNARALLWDDASLLVDQSNNLGIGTPRVVGNPSQVPTYILDEGLFNTTTSTLPNGLSAMSVKPVQGESVGTLFRIYGFTNVANTLYPVKYGFKDVMTWYAKFATNSGGSTFDEGVWAFGRGKMNTNMGISKLLDTSSLGTVLQSRWIGDTCWFINHSGDGSISRLHRFDTGTYNVTAKAETVWYGNETPYQKELNGISIVTSPLPSGGSVEMFYRLNDNSSWVSMGASGTVGKMKHSFTKANGIPIGKFQEIQFKFEVTGKVSVQNVLISITETDDLSF